MILSGLTVAFATVPEALPILLVVLLAVGGRQLARFLAAVAPLYDGAIVDLLGEPGRHRP